MHDDRLDGRMQSRRRCDAASDECKADNKARGSRPDPGRRYCSKTIGSRSVSPFRCKVHHEVCVLRRLSTAHAVPSQAFLFSPCRCAAATYDKFLTLSAQLPGYDEAGNERRSESITE